MLSFSDLTCSTHNLNYNIQSKTMISKPILSKDKATQWFYNQRNDVNLYNNLLKTFHFYSVLEIWLPIKTRNVCQWNSLILTKIYIRMVGNFSTNCILQCIKQIRASFTYVMHLSCFNFNMWLLLTHLQHSINRFFLKWSF